MQGLERFRRALPKHERVHFDGLMEAIRQRRTAGGMLPGHDHWPPFVLSMLIGLMSRLEVLEERLAALERAERAD